MGLHWPGGLSSHFLTWLPLGWTAIWAPVPYLINSKDCNCSFTSHICHYPELNILTFLIIPPYNYLNQLFWKHNIRRSRWLLPLLFSYLWDPSCFHLFFFCLELMKHHCSCSLTGIFTSPALLSLYWFFLATPQLRMTQLPLSQS